jgi:lipopolysaccharide O-acetyltransferase
MKRTLKELLYLSRCFIYTKLEVPSARLIRLPIDIRNKKGVDFGNNLTTGYGCRIETFSENGIKALRFGENVQINDYVHIAALEGVKIGDNVLIASKVFISDLNHGSYNGDEKDTNPNEIAKNRKLSSTPVEICNNVWIGELCSILPGVTIGENCIIGANSVVTKNIPPNSIAVGNPAKVIKQYNFSTKKWEKI